MFPATVVVPQKSTPRFGLMTKPHEQKVSFQSAEVHMSLVKTPNDGELGKNIWFSNMLSWSNTNKSKKAKMIKLQLLSSLSEERNLVFLM